MGPFTSTHLPYESLDYAFAAVLDRTDVSGIGDGLAADQIAALRTCACLTFYGSRSAVGACTGEIVGTGANDAKTVVECAAALSDAAPARWPAAPLTACASARAGELEVEAWLATLTPGVRPLLMFARNAGAAPAGLVRDELWISALPIDTSTARMISAYTGTDDEKRIIRRG